MALRSSIRVNRFMIANGRSKPAPDQDEPAGTDAPAASVSPSLHAEARLARRAAYEIKFLVTAGQALEVEERLRHVLRPDPHSDPALGGMYSIVSVACDDPAFSAFFREERVKNRKYRVRRYGAADVVYLERKRSRKGRVRKRRVAAPLAGLADLAAGRAGDAAHAWFVHEVRAGELTPVCRIRYLRRALFGAGPEGPVRVTIDRGIRGGLVRGWSLDARGEERPLLDGAVVCEFKFTEAMPAPLKALAAAMRLEATGVSKYRTCVRAFARELGVTLPPGDAAARGARGGNGEANGGVDHA